MMGAIVQKLLQEEEKQYIRRLVSKDKLHKCISNAFR